MTTRILITYPAALTLAATNPHADITATGSGMVVHLPDADYVAIRPGAAS